MKVLFFLSFFCIFQFLFPPHPSLHTSQVNLWIWVTHKKKTLTFWKRLAERSEIAKSTPRLLLSHKNLISLFSYFKTFERKTKKDEKTSGRYIFITVSYKSHLAISKGSNSSMDVPLALRTKCAFKTIIDLCWPLLKWFIIYCDLFHDKNRIEPWSRD